jgi:hypothetical protein
VFSKADLSLLSILSTFGLGGIVAIVFCLGWLSNGAFVEEHVIGKHRGF